MFFFCSHKIVSASESGTINVHSVNGKQLHAFECGANMRRMRVNPNDMSTIVTVGQENLLKTWDLNRCEQNGEFFLLNIKSFVRTESKPTFTCKNLPHDWLQLRVPVCDNDVRFVVDSPLIVSCTADHEVSKPVFGFCVFAIVSTPFAPSCVCTTRAHNAVPSTESTTASTRSHVWTRPITTAMARIASSPVQHKDTWRYTTGAEKVGANIIIGCFVKH
jgi:hypothetical protein